MDADGPEGAEDLSDDVVPGVPVETEDHEVESHTLQGTHRIRLGWKKVMRKLAKWEVGFASRQGFLFHFVSVKME